MGVEIATEHYAAATVYPEGPRAVSSTPRAAAGRVWALLTAKPVVEFALVFLAYFVAGKLGQATTNIRSSNLGPVWPAYGIAVAAFLAFGHRAWLAVAPSAFLVAYQSPVPALAAAGQTIGATLAAASAAFFLRRIADFDPTLPRLRDALGFITQAALGSALVSATVGVASLYLTHVQAYSGLGSAWLIYWLGDSTGVLLVTPLVFTLPALFAPRSRRRGVECAAVMTLSAVACLIVFGGLPLVSIQFDVLAFAVLPFVMWAAIDFGIGGAALSVFIIATIATLSTALGLGPFTGQGAFVGAVLLDTLFMVLAVSGLTLAAVIAEREHAEAARAGLVRERMAMESRLRLAAIVESSNDAILSTDMGRTILSWNAAAERIFGFTAAEVVGRPVTMLIPDVLQDEAKNLFDRLKAGERVDHFETIRLAKSGKQVPVSLKISPVADADGRLVGSASICRDISEQKRIKEALSNVNRKLIEAQEQERSRIARELHDDVAQRLALLAFDVEELVAHTTTAPPLHDKSVALRDRVSELATDVQALSHELHSPKLQLLGITSAIRDFSEEAARHQNAMVDFDAHDVPEHVPPDISLCLFRVVQEGVHNAVKHSGVRHVQVRLWGTAGQLHLVVSDHGAGFDVERATAGQGIGLVSMAERIKLVDGELAIESQPGRGTTIRARVRLAGEAERARSDR
ncbi:MAG TPA: MASE1 domain-containing protein [Vicinamibacterales bacterium]|jgi:PAS domain S-box-containing protein|nr:MASE1 domain-containing protein [Vicinamibacterales bacterium]